MRCNDPGANNHGAKQTYFWVMETPGGDIVYTHKPGRAHEHAAALLGENYQGILQSDAYPCYQKYAREHPGVTALGCWAHARRKFYEAQNENPRIARLALKLIGGLYRCEREWNAQGWARDHARLWLRHRRYPRLLNTLKTQMLKRRGQVLPQSQTGKAITYLLNQWDSLAAHANHGCTRLDTNLIENDIRPSAVGKRNVSDRPNAS